MTLFTFDYFKGPQPLENSEELKEKFVFTKYDIDGNGLFTLNDFQQIYSQITVEENILNIFGQPLYKAEFKKHINRKCIYISFISRIINQLLLKNL